MVPIASDLRLAFAQEGKRWTGARETVLSVLEKSALPISAKDIFKQVHSSGVNLASIYRTTEMLAERGIEPERIILVQKPYMERRAYATFKKVWPEPKLIVTSPEISFEDYPTPELPLELVINIMVGDLQRIRLYPALGFQIEQEIPEEVWEAGQKLIALGYNRHLVKS